MRATSYIALWPRGARVALLAIAAGLLLASACGDGDESGEPTPETTAPVEATATSEVIAPTEEPTEPAATERIAFTSDRDGNGEIYVMNADGSGQTNLTDNPANDSSPAWSPDGSRIAFTSDRDGTLEIYVMNADGSGVTRLTNNSAGDFSPAWSPDSSRIAFVSTRDSADGDIYVMSADGSGQTRLTNHFGIVTEPAWSPDDTRIAFTGTNAARHFGIFAVRADGSDFASPAVGLLFLPTQPLSVQQPAWSPDGSRVAFSAWFSSQIVIPESPVATAERTAARLADINVMPAEGAGAGFFDFSPLTDDPAADSDPAWSRDGTRIAFQSDRDEPNPDTCHPSCNTEIYVMNADGSGQTRLTNNPAADREPAWSPTP